VCFWNDESAQAVLNESRALNEGSFGEVRHLARPSVSLVPD